jgi:PAS domain S-box-containing protein
MTTMVHDPARLEALRRSGLLDSAPEEAFDRIVRLASLLLRVRVALVSLVDSDRQFFKSSVGLGEPWASRRQTPLSHCFCQHVVRSGVDLVVEDARVHPLVQDNAAIPDLGVVAYAGTPIRTPDGHILGTLCAIEPEPRVWSAADLQTLHALAEMVMTELALRHARRELEAEGTRRRQAEERLTVEKVRHASALEDAREAARQVGSILEAISDGFVFLDTSWRYTYVNARAGQLLGRSPEQLLGKNIWTEFPDGVRQKLHLACEQAAREHRTIQIEEYYPPYHRWFENRIHPSSEGLAIFFQDVTERKLLEQRLLRSAKLETIGRLAGGIAHDFNNLLGVVLAEAQRLLSSDLAAGTTREGIEEIREAAQRAADVTRQLLDFGRENRAAPRTFGLAALVVEMEHMLRKLVGPETDLRVVSAGERTLVRGDPGQVSQVIMNLAMNGREAMGPRGRLTIATEPVALSQPLVGDTGVAAPGDWVRLTVTDTGRGLDEEVRRHVFEPLFTTKEGGTGLGLATVERIVREAGGQILIVSSPGAGASFQVYFPATVV